MNARMCAALMILSVMGRSISAEGTLGIGTGTTVAEGGVVRSYAAVEGAGSLTFDTAGPWAAYIDMGGRISENVDLPSVSSGRTESNVVAEAVLSYLDLGPVFRFSLTGIHSGVYHHSGEIESFPVAVGTIDTSGGGVALGWFADAEYGRYGSSFNGWWARSTTGMSIAPAIGIIVEPEASVRYSVMPTKDTAWTGEVSIRGKWFGSSVVSGEVVLAGSRHVSTVSEVLVEGTATVDSQSHWGVSLEPLINWAPSGNIRINSSALTELTIFDHRAYGSESFRNQSATSLLVTPEVEGVLQLETAWNVGATVGGRFNVSNSNDREPWSITAEITAGWSF